MIKAVIKLCIFNIPFFLVSAVLFYLGFISDDNVLTDDGVMNRKLFLYLMGGGFLGLTLIINAVSLRGMVKKRNRINEIITYGKQGTAKILKMTDTGVTVNDSPRVKFLLEISIPNYPTYQAQKTVEIPIINLPQVQPGLTVNVLADPEQPHNENRIGIVLK